MSLFDAFGFKGKRVVVVGAATGMGNAAAQLVLAAGGDVVAMVRAPVTLEGVTTITLRQLAQALERNKVQEINPPASTKFDPHHHQAISMVPAEQDANTVVAVLQKGYLIADRVLRPALVTVAAPK